MNRRLIAASFSVLALTTLGACGNEPAAEQTPTANPTTDQTSLPDSIPLPSGATLYTPAEPIEGDSRVRGWTAVAVTPAASSVGDISSSLSLTLGQSGWATTKTGSDDSGVTIAGSRPLPVAREWLNISVTAPLPGAGPAITYRYATGQNPFSRPADSG